MHGEIKHSVEGRFVYSPLSQGPKEIYAHAESNARPPESIGRLEGYVDRKVPDDGRILTSCPLRNLRQPRVEALQAMTRPQVAVDQARSEQRWG